MYGGKADDENFEDDFVVDGILLLLARLTSVALRRRRVPGAQVASQAFVEVVENYLAQLVHVSLLATARKTKRRSDRE